MKRYEQIKPKELTEIEFADMMGKLLGHALISPVHAGTVAAGCTTIAAQCRVFAKQDSETVIEEWDKSVDLDSRFMLKNAIISHEDGEKPPEEPVDMFEEKGVTDKEILSIAESMKGAIAVMMIIGTSGVVPNLMAAAVLKGMSHRLKEAAESRGVDISDWYRQVANAENRVAAVAMAEPEEIAVTSKGGDA